MDVTFHRVGAQFQFHFARASTPPHPRWPHLHVSMEVVEGARRVGLDLLTLPSHTLQALQPLVVSVFKPFKQFFRQYMDFWMSRNLNELSSKDTLA